MPSAANLRDDTRLAHHCLQFPATRLRLLFVFSPHLLVSAESHASFLACRIELPEPQEVSMWRDFAACVNASRSAERAVQQRDEAVPPSLQKGSSAASSAWWVQVARDTQQVVHAIVQSMKQNCAPVQV